MNTRLRLRADFNGVFREEGGGFLVCLSHAETCRDERGSDITVNEGTTATAFDEDVDERGNRDDLLASGTIERAPDWLAKHGSRWILRVDEKGIRHQSDTQEYQRHRPREAEGRG